MPGHERQRQAGLGLSILDLFSSVGESEDGITSQPVSGEKKQHYSLFLSVGRIIEGGSSVGWVGPGLEGRPGFGEIQERGSVCLQWGLACLEVGGDKCCLHRERGAGWPGRWGPYSEMYGLGLGRLVLGSRGWRMGKGSSGNTSLEQKPK